MNWAYLRRFPFLDTRAAFVAQVPRDGSLLDLGSSDGETLRHFAELRPDLQIHAVDLADRPEMYPPNCQFHRADLERDRLPWPDSSMDAVTCLHLLEHLHDQTLLLREVARLLKPGGRVYFETPHPKTLALPSLRGAFTLNFYDDPTHVQLVTMGALGQQARQAGLEVVGSGISRNWLFAAAHLIFVFLPPSRKKFTARVHWLGWSACLTAQRPP
jgi:SAM-dependent methyltransferase